MATVHPTATNEWEVKENNINDPRFQFVLCDDLMICKHSEAFTSVFRCGHRGISTERLDLGPVCSTHQPMGQLGGVQGIHQGELGTGKQNGIHYGQ